MRTLLIVDPRIASSTPRGWWSLPQQRRRVDVPVESVVTALRAGTVEAMHIRVRDQVEAGDLVVEIP